MKKIKNKGLYNLLGFFLLPFFAALMLFAKDNFEQGKQLENRVWQIRNFSLQHQDYDNYRFQLWQNWQNWQNILPDDFEGNEWSLRVQGDCALHGLQLENLQFRTKNAKNKVKNLTHDVFDLQVTGECGTLLDVMENLEKEQGNLFWDEVCMEPLEDNRIIMKAVVYLYSCRGKEK